MTKEEYPLLAIRLEVLPGNSLAARFSNAARYGFDAVELPGIELAAWRDELLAVHKQLPLPVCSISRGFRGSLLSADEAIRKRCRGDIEKLLDLCAELGAVGLVVPPFLFVDNCRRLTGGMEDAILGEQLAALAEYAAGKAVYLMIEPVNRAETDYLSTIGHALRLCEQIGNPWLAITADWFHMAKEETDSAQALRACGKWLRNFHVSERPNRTEPAPGGLDFATAFKVMREIGYRGYTVLECRGLSGPADEVLPRSVAYLKNDNTCRH